MKASVGVAEHGNSAVLVTVASGEVIDRRRVDLTSDLPTHPYHHEGSWAVGRYVDSPWARPTTLEDAIALVDRVRAAAAEGARAALEELARSRPASVVAIGIRVCPALPATTEACIRDARAASMADSILYRQALATAATARGWSVHAYDRDRVLDDAKTALRALDGRDLDAFLRAAGKRLGPPWQAIHKLATAAALAARPGAVE